MFMESALISTIKFTCIGKGHGAPCTPASREEWEQLRREPWLAQMCERIAKGDDELKHRLPVWTPQCAEFANNHRAIADAIKPLNRLMLDFDEKGHTDDILSKLKIENGELKNGCAEPDLHGMVVLLVEESVRHGTHVLVELPDGMTAEQAQELMKEATGFTPDAAVKDVSRCIYMVPEDHTKYVSEKLFEVTTNGVLLTTTETTNTTFNGDKMSPQAEVLPEKLSKLSMLSSKQKDELSFKGIRYNSIISEWWRRNGGEPAEGERNVKLHKLAVNLRAICDNKKEAFMPRRRPK